MKLLLGMLMLFMVSGFDMETIDGFLGANVRLSCTCLDRNLAKDFKWQTEKKGNIQLVYIQYSQTNTSKYGESYKGRVQTFLDENISNCSIILKNVTAEDQGEYKCIFNRGGLYNYSLLNLTILPRHSIDQYYKYLSDEKVFHCDVKGGDNNTIIQWTADGKVLKNSPVINISTMYTQHAPTGLFNFKSELKTKLNWTSGPECGIITNEHGPPEGIALDQDTDRTHSFAVLPFVLVVGALLILCYYYT